MVFALAIGCGDAQPGSGEASTSGDASSDATDEVASSTSSSSEGTGESSTGDASTSTTGLVGCDAIECPSNATCEEDGEEAWCVCEAELFANNGKCVDTILLALPMENTDGSLISGVIGLDHDPAAGESVLDCDSYQGEPFPNCYDGHSGTDFILFGGFDRMDNGSAVVFAAADGEVVEVHDGEFDRCRLNLQTQRVECENGGPVTPANRIAIAHADGRRTEYLHLKKGSITVTVGDRVVCGDPMALVGSSGNSSMPHLHFTLVDVDGTEVDPYAGRYSQPDTAWVDQSAAHDLPTAACQ